MTVNEVQDELIEEFQVFDDWMDKYQYLIDLSNELPQASDTEKTSDNLINGCQSKVWLVPEFKDGTIYFRADSDAVITKGLVALLLKVFSGRNPQEILDTDLYFIDQVGLKEHLSPTRSNGLLAMIKQIKLYAMAYQSKQKEGDQ